jgi:DNA-directed RNA polymerase subunit L
MNPTLSAISEEGDLYSFTLSGLNVSLANSLRRTILSDIPVNGFYTENYVNNQCTFLVNTSRLHNEILKQRLSCIPVHETDLTLLPNKYILDVDVQNDTDTMLFVTTEDFKIRNKTTGTYLTAEQTRQIFPPSPKTNMFIDFARLRPKIGDSITGEHIKFTAEFSVQSAKQSSTFNVVSKCSYGNTPDKDKANAIWEELDAKLRSESMTAEEIETQKRNFYLLDAQRYYLADSFDFSLQTLGIYENTALVKKACAILQQKLIDIVQLIDSSSLPILLSDTTMDNCFDITLENEDYTIGKVLEYILYEKYYQGEKILTYCGFKKFHPHDSDSTIRIAYIESADKQMVSQHVRMACISAGEVYKTIYGMF